MFDSIKLWCKTEILKEESRSDWMKGLLWAESVPVHIRELYLTLPVSEAEVINLYQEAQEPFGKITGEFMRGVFDYLKHYEERLL